MTTVLALPTFNESEVVLPPPDSGPRNWSGASSVVLVDDVFWLAYRVRRPLSVGRGVATVIARSDNGVDFTTVTELPREDFGAESFERPALLPRPEGGWRIYLSCATPGTKHWWTRPSTRRRRVSFPGGRAESSYPVTIGRHSRTPW